MMNRSQLRWTPCIPQRIDEQKTSTPRAAAKAKASRDDPRTLALRPIDRKQTPLHLAIEAGDHDAVAELAKDGLAWKWVGSEDKFGSTPMELAAGIDGQGLVFDQVARMHRELLKSDSGAIKRQRQAARQAISLALSKSAIQGEAKRLETLISMGADVNLAKLDESPPLILASYWGRQGCVEALIQAGADLGAVDDVGNSALSMAAVSQATGCLRSLIQAGAELDHRNLHGQTPLWLAVDESDLECAKELIEAEADVEAAARRE